MNSIITIQPLKVDHIAAIVEIHQKAFPESALTRLGREGLRRYYRWMLQGPHEVIPLGAFAGHQVIGFCFGGIFRGALSGFVRKNRLFLIWRVFTHPWLIFNSIFRDRLVVGAGVLRRSLVPTSDPTSSPKPKPSKLFGIHVIAIDTEHQRRGVGQLLMAESEKIALDRGFRRMHLSVHPDNDQAIRFYTRLGWQKAKANNGWIEHYVKELDELLIQ